MKHLNTFIYAVLAGIAISIGGVAFLAIDNKVVGAAFFSVGLFAVCTLGLNLYTGKICYVFDNKPAYFANCLLMWVGNLVGALLAGSAIRATRLTAVIEKAVTVSETKLNDTLLSVFILAIFCDILIYLAVEGYKNNPHELGKYLGIFMGVTVFVAIGFEHCVANMFYFTVAGAWSGKTLLYVLVMTLGNSVGGVLFPLCRKLKTAVEAKA
jgi:formate/nitrite transporter FocA (FNT family)